MGYNLSQLPTDHWTSGYDLPSGGDPNYGGPGENPGGGYWQPPNQGDPGQDTGGFFPDPANGSYGPQQPGQGGGSSSWLPDWLNPVGGFNDNIGMANGTSAILGASALNQLRNAGQYSQMGKDAAAMSDPFGQYRRGYGDRLQQLYDDPSSIENTPGYKFALQQGLGALDRKDAARGLTGSGLQDKDRMDYASGLAQQTWNTEANRLGQFAGSQFDPSNAGKLWMQGAQNSINSQNAALGSLLGMYAAQMQGKYANGGNTPSGSGSPGSGSGLPPGLDLTKITPEVARWLDSKFPNWRSDNGGDYRPDETGAGGGGVPGIGGSGEDNIDDRWGNSGRDWTPDPTDPGGDYGGGGGGWTSNPAWGGDPADWGGG